MPNQNSRKDFHSVIAPELARMNEAQLHALIESVPLSHSGTGGSSCVIRVDGTEVFVKKILSRSGS